MSLYNRIKILLLCLLPLGAAAQLPVNRSPATVQVRDARLQAYLNLIAPRYSDSVQANTNKGLDSLGAIYYDSTANNFYFRGVDVSMTHKWIAFGSGGGGGGNTIYNANDAITGDRTVDLNDKILQFYQTAGTTGNFTVNLNGASSGTFFSRGVASAQQYAATATNTNGINENATYTEIYGATSTHSSRIRTYTDSLIFNNDVGFYRFRNAVASTDTVTYKPFAISPTGEVVRLSTWAAGSRTLYAKNALHARNDSTIVWGTDLDSPTVINGGTTYTLRYSGILNGVKFDENPTFNTTSTTGYVWTAQNSSGLGGWQASGVTSLSANHIFVGVAGTATDVAPGGDVASISTSGSFTLATVNANTGSWGDATHIPQFTVNGKGLITAVASVAISAGSSLTRQNITSGTSATVTGGNYIINFDPSSVIATYTLTLPASPSDLDVVEIEAGGTVTSGNPVITALTISPNSGQTLIEAVTPSTINAGEYIKYRYKTSVTSWYREN